MNNRRGNKASIQLTNTKRGNYHLYGDELWSKPNIKLNQYNIDKLIGIFNIRIGDEIINMENFNFFKEDELQNMKN